MTSNPLLGFVSTDQKNPTEEEDQLERSTKKVKEGKHPKVVVGDLIGNTVTYKDMVTGGNSETEKAEYDTEADMLDQIIEDIDGMTVEENLMGGYECPNFVLSDREEKRIHRPWRRGVIVKLLGRKIGYKALENRLRQMWVKKGVISIIDLSNDYYLVAFSHEDDKRVAMGEGPWFIYDHYLTVKDWCPNFHPKKDTIEEVAVWVRIAGLPIEYYDSRVLTFIGNRLGKAVKVDKNTVKQERGKYARMCVEVNLTKPLLAMFSIKGRRYKIEYEGLHLLCLHCGRYGHYKEGCPLLVKGKMVESNRSVEIGESSTSELRILKEPDAVDGPWTVVQKQRRGNRLPEKKKQWSGEN
ncbi:uncharacterized protein LOC131639472 [Vicia villosa]|uniref:uncharacterized protein LOC131639472 n=1 Tax=Vicia villosa TaxID=3911 RepID=UPI00273BE73C|nr:uncharacterized protein LOC131639472 [Vicia villosa]